MPTRRVGRAAAFALFLAILVSGRAAAATCSTAGQQQYSSASGIMQYCDGTSWVAMMKWPVLSACAGAPAGKIRYSGGLYQFCDGTSWYSMKGALIGACAPAEAGKQKYTGRMQFCDGTNWYAMTGCVSTGCPLASTVACGTAYQDNCGASCGTGSTCASGYSCSSDACVPMIGTWVPMGAGMSGSDCPGNRPARGPCTPIGKTCDHDTVTHGSGAMHLSTQNHWTWYRCQ
jgi:hypothetical protein